MAEVHLIGQIVGASYFEDRSLFSKWSINSGSSWKVLEGLTEGQTHLSSLNGKSGIGSSNEKDTSANKDEETSHSWSHPIDVHFSARSLQGWPRFEFQVWGVDWLGKCNISAYGFMSIPTRPGLHKLTCSTWRPVGDFRRRLVDYITGYRMHLVDPSDVISNGLNRHVIQAMSMGTIRVELNVILKGFDNYGVEII